MLLQNVHWKKFKIHVITVDTVNTIKMHSVLGGKPMLNFVYCICLLFDRFWRDQECMSFALISLQNDRQYPIILCHWPNPLAIQHRYEVQGKNYKLQTGGRSKCFKRLAAVKPYKNYRKQKETLYCDVPGSPCLSKKGESSVWFVSFVDGPKDPWPCVLSLPECFFGAPASLACDKILLRLARFVHLLNSVSLFCKLFRIQVA